MADGTAGNNRPITQPESKLSFDLVTLLGIGGSLLLISTAIFLGGSPGAFIDIPSIFIVLGGTVGVTIACFSLKDFANAIKTLSETFLHSVTDPNEAAVQQLQLAQIARFKGVLALQGYLSSISDQRLLELGLTMAVDGNTGEEIERVLKKNVETSMERISTSVSVLKKAADLSPAMGLIGTLVGLVQMLGNLEDPNSIGPAMAVALLTTFYGAMLSNVVFTPLASKMERTATEQLLLDQMYVLTASSIGRQENPRRLEMLLNTVLPPSKQVDYFK